MPFDKLLQSITERRPYSSQTPPIVELTSFAPGAGKTDLLYHLIACALLPPNQGCVIVLDTDLTFSATRLALQFRQLAQARGLTTEIETLTTKAIQQVHVFRPQALRSAISTLDALPSYLFDASRHRSLDHHVAFIAIDSASVFHWEERAESEDAAFEFHVDSTPRASVTDGRPPSKCVSLAAALKKTCKTFSCPALVTSRQLGFAASSAHGVSDETPQRSPLPAPWPSMVSLRFTIRRVPVRKFPPGICFEQAARESGERRKAVEKGKFEAVVDETNVDGRVRSQIRGSDAGFGFTITSEGVVVDL